MISLEHFPVMWSYLLYCSSEVRRSFMNARTCAFIHQTLCAPCFWVCLPQRTTSLNGANWKHTLCFVIFIISVNISFAFEINVLLCFILSIVQQRQILQLNQNSSLQMTPVIELRHRIMSLLLYSKCAQMSQDYTGYKSHNAVKEVHESLIWMKGERTSLAGTKAILDSQSVMTGEKE